MASYDDVAAAALAGASQSPDLHGVLRPVEGGQGRSVSGEGLADRRAREQFAANLLVLRSTQPKSAQLLAGSLSDRLLDGYIFLFGRDGSLTARQELDGADPSTPRWWAGTSLPLKVGRALMESLESHGGAACLVAPSTAGLLRAVLEKTPASEAILVIWQRPLDALMALHCGDFSRDISAGRLWLACGADWPAELSDILQSNPGLCIPQQYIRTGLQDDSEIYPLIDLANGVFSGETARRTELISHLRREAQCHRRAPSASKSRKCLVASASAFHLWDLAGPALAKALSSAGDAWQRLDISQPASSSPLALAAAAQDCDALVTADLYRSDLAGIVPDELPWITWATRPRFSPPAPGAKRDAILLADETWRSLAVAAGWPAHRIAIAGWPELAPQTPPPPSAPIVLIADAPVTEIPKRLKDFSSHGLLWEQITAELAADPFALGEDIDAYLSSRLRRMGINDTDVDTELFKNKLILPSWRRSVAAALLRAKLPLVIHGYGWDDDTFTVARREAVGNMDELIHAAASAAILVHPDPQGAAHPVMALGRPVARPASLLRQGLRAPAIRIKDSGPLCQRSVLSLIA